jgi:fibronectin type 3 domain-containing protein
MKKLKIFTIFLGVGIFSTGCINNSLDKPLKSDKALKSVEKVTSVPDTTAVAFEWELVKDNIAGYNIYRREISDKSNFSGKLERIAVIEDKYSSHYVDTGLKPETRYQYRFTTYTVDDRESVGSKFVYTTTIKNILPPVYIITVPNLPNMTKLIWRPHTDPRVSGYVIERQELANNDWKQVGELNHRYNVEFIDRELDSNKVYKYRVRAKSFDKIVSEPSEIIDTKTKPLPRTVMDVKTTNNLAKEIKLSWQENDEIRGYRIYRSSSKDWGYSKLGEVRGITYSDKIKDDGKEFYYKVVAVDNDGLEGSKDNIVPIIGSTLKKPKAPSITKTSIKNNKISIEWELTDQRTIKYKVIRTYGQPFNKQTNDYYIDENNFIDNDVSLGIEYTYEIFAIDQYEILSNPAEVSDMKIKK